MKLLPLFFLFSVPFTMSLCAQNPEISSSNQIPSIGDTISYIEANTFGFNPDGSGGQIDVIWDYQNFQTVGEIDFYFVDPMSSQSASEFPTADIAQVTSQSLEGFEFFGTTANSISRLGYDFDGEQLIVYDSSWTRYEFPLIPGITQASSYSGRLEGLGSGEDSVTVEMGNYAATPDAFGQLILPPSTFGGTPNCFNDVVRIHVIESFRINVWFYGVIITTVDVTDDYYFYFQDEVQEPLLIYGVTSDTGGGQPQTVLRYQPTEGVCAVGLEELELIDFQVYPNPCSSEFSYSFENILPIGNHTLSLRDALGRTIFSRSLQTGVQSGRLNVSELDYGMYFLTVELDGRQILRKRLIVE